MKKFLHSLALGAMLCIPWVTQGQQALPYSYGFEDNDLSADGWTTQNPSGLDASEFGINSVAKKTGDYGFRFSSYNAHGEHTQYLISPELDAANGVVVQFSYKQSSSSGTEKFKVGYSTTNSDISSFTFGSEMTASTSWTLSDEFNFPAGTKYVAIYYYSDYQYRFYVDDITFAAPASCPKPTALEAQLTPGNGSVATLSWTKGGSESNWVLEYSTASDFTGATQVTSGFITTNDPSISVNLTGLTPEQTYYARVAAVCEGEEDPSEWSNTVSFTPTDSYIITVFDSHNEIQTSLYIPMYGNYFDYYTKSECIIPATELTTMQWGSITSITFYAKTVGTNNSTWANTNQKVFVKEVPATTLGGSYSGMDGATIVFDGLLPMPTTSTDGYTITFSHPYTYSGGNLLIGVYNDDVGSYNSVTWYGTTGLTSGVSAYGSNSSSLASVSYNAQTFLPKTTFNYTPGEAPSCLLPSGLQEVAETTPTTNSVQLTWTAGASEEAWDIYYTTSASDIPDENTTPSRENIHDNPFTLEGLTHSTHYYVYVRANCGGEQSLWSQRGEFTTACDVVDVDGSHPFNVDLKVSAIPICWSQTDGTYTWSFSSTNGATFSTSAYSVQTSTKLISPVFALGTGDYWMNFTGKLYGYYDWYDDYTATLKIYYRTSTDGDWTLLEGQNYSATGETQNLNVEGVVLPAGTCQLAFEATTDYSSSYAYLYGLTIEQVPSCRRPSGLMLNTPSGAVTAHTATLKWTNGSNDQEAWQIAYKAGSNFDPNDEEALATATIVNADANPFTITNLPTQSTTYYAYVRADCGNDDYSAWSTNYVTFTTLYGNLQPTAFSYDPASLTSHEVTVSWTGVATNDRHESYELYYNNDGTAPTAETDAIIVGIDAETYHFEAPEALEAETQYYMWVRDYCGTDGRSAWTALTESYFTTAGDCETPDGLAASNVTNTSATITWNTYGQEGFNLRYKKATDEEWTAVNGLTTAPYILNNVLEGNTAYQVQVQATCNTEEWSTVMSFTTKCDAISVETEAYTYDFEDAAPFVCWSPISGNVTRMSGNTHGGSYRLDFRGTTSNMIALPAFEEPTNTLQVTFWTRPESTSGSSGKFAVGYMTNIADASSFVAVETYNSTEMTQTYVQKTVYLANVPANARIAMRQFDCATNYYWFVDDIEVSLAPSCLPVGTLSYDNVEATSAELTWTLVDDHQGAWVVEYATDADFTTVRTADADRNDAFTLDNLYPNTHYWVRVKADCDGEVSNVVNFTTDIACPAPRDLTLVEATIESLTVSWTNGDEGDNSWTVCYKAESEEEFHCNETSENPYTIVGLTQGTNYTVKVMTNCANDYPSPELVSTDYFPTVATCPAPTSLAVTPESETAQGATISWEGGEGNNNYIIEYAEGPLAGVATLLEENFEGNDMPTGWSIMGLGTDNWSVSGSNNAGGAPNEMNLTWNPSFNGISRLVTSAIDLTGITEVTFAFKHNLNNYSGSNILGIATSSDGGTTWTDGWSQSYSENGTYTVSEVISTSDMGNANVKFCIYYEGNSYNINDWYFDDVVITAEYTPTYTWNTLDDHAESPYEIHTLNSETEYVVRVKGDCSGIASPASSIVGFRTIEACGAPTDLVLGDVEARQASFSWTPGVANTSWNVYVKKHADENYPTTPNAEVDVAPTAEHPVTIENLDPNTAYDVKIVPDCDASKFLEVENAFTTPCEAYTITMEAPYTQDFESPVVTTTYDQVGEMPGCWENYPATSASAKILTAGAQYNYASSGQVLYFYGNGNNYAMLPEFANPLNELAISFKYATESYSNGTLTLGYITDEDENYNTFTAIDGGTFAASNASYHTLVDVAPISLGSLPANATRLVFRWYYSGQWGANVDDVKVGIPHTITAVANPTEGGNVTGAGNYFHGDEATLTATANEGYTFVNWTEGNAEVSTEATYTIDNVTADRELEANFELNHYTLTINYKYADESQAAETYTAEVNYNAPYSVTSPVITGYTADQLTVAGTMGTENVTVDVTYTINTYDITATANLTEGGTVTGAGTYNHGEEATLTATANEGYEFVRWTDGNELVSTSATYSFTVTAARELVANFEYVYENITMPIVAKKWYAIASPVHNDGDNQTVAGVTNLVATAPAKYDLFRYNEAIGTWENSVAANFSTLERGRGYLYRRTDNANLVFTGLANTEDFNTNTTASCADNTLKGFNLLGNPYNQVYTPNVEFYTLTPDGMWAPKTLGETVEPTEAFLIHVDEAGTYAFELPTASGAKNAPLAQSALRFSVTNGEYTDVAYVRFDEGEGLPKISHLNAEAPMLSVDGYAIAHMEESVESFPMSFSGKGEYTLTVENGANLGYLHLIDRTTGRDIDLLTTDSYSFNAAGAADRFMVKLVPSTDAEGNTVFVRVSGNSVIVEGSGMLQVFDVMGRQLATSQVEGTTTLDRHELGMLSSGVYVLRLAGESQKVVVK